MSLLVPLKVLVPLKGVVKDIFEERLHYTLVVKTLVVKASSSKDTSSKDIFEERLHYTCVFTTSVFTTSVFTTSVFTTIFEERLHYTPCPLHPTLKKERKKNTWCIYTHIYTYIHLAIAYMFMCWCL